MAELENVLVPIYLYHRYQVQAAAKLIGGLDYSYNVRGDNLPNPSIVAPNRQKAALQAVLSTITPKALRMPDKIVNLIPPRPLGYYNSRELFRSHTDPAFDPLGAAETAANMTAQLLFNANRDARLVEYHAQNDRNLGFDEMIDYVLKSTWEADPPKGYNGAVQRSVDFVVLYNMIHLAMDKNAANQVRAIVNQRLEEMYAWLKTKRGKNRLWQAAYTYAAKLIDNYKDHPDRIKSMTKPLTPPPGSPIGSGIFF